MVVAENRYLAEDAAARIQVDYERAAAVVGIPAARAAKHAVHEDIPDNIAAHLVQQVGDVDAAMARRAAPARIRPDHRAVVLDAAGGQGRARPLGPRRPQPAGLLLHPGSHLGAGRDRRQTRPAAAEGRGDRAGCRRRFRGEDHAPVAGGDPGADGRDAARPAGQVDRGPAGAFHLLRPRARAGAPHQGRLRRRRKDSRARRHVLARQRRLHPVRDHLPDRHLDPVARARTSRVPTGWSSIRSTPPR